MAPKASVLEPDFESELDPTPTPRPVAVDIPIGLLDLTLAPQDAEPPPAPPSALRRVMMVATAAVLFVAVVLAIKGAPGALASSAPQALAANALVQPRALAAADLEAPVEVASIVKPAPTDPAARSAVAVAKPPVSVPVANVPVANVPVAKLPVAKLPVGADDRADAKVEHKGYAPIHGGVLFVPTTFASEDGSYDLYLHFHGNPAIVRESAEYAGLNAVVAVVNLGINSAPYLYGLASPGHYENLLASIDHAVALRGLKTPHLRRVALGSWSGGYGGISKVLEHEIFLPSIDAILVLDGIHCGWVDDAHKVLNTRIIAPFFEAVRWAAQGKLLFSITHSEVDPPYYAASSATASFLLELVNGSRGDPSPAPEHVRVPAAARAVSKKLEKWMEPTTEARVGSFHVRGFRGNTKEHHTAHLLQMAATVMPELVARWAPKADEPSPR